MKKQFQKAYTLDGNTAELFRKLYTQDVKLPEEIGSRVSVLSCLAYSEKQQVYLTRNRKGRRFILKTAQEERLASLRREARMLREQSFSFLPRYVYYTEREEKGYFLREYIEGDTLWEWVSKQGPLGMGEASELMCRLCGMAEQLHSQKPPMIHRDIKPQNIVLTAEKNLFMIDMGTVRRHRENSVQDTVLLGSRPTAAPEQYGYSQTDARSDIYALGVLYLYLLTGSMDVQGIRTQESVPFAVRRIIIKCTKMDPNDRYQSCGELRRAIAALRSRRACSGKRLAAAAGTGAVLLGTAFFRRKQTE